MSRFQLEVRDRRWLLRLPKYCGFGLEKRRLRPIATSQDFTKILVDGRVVINDKDAVVGH